MSGGSVYNPQEQGLGVPFEMTFGLHSDAGFSKEDELIGTLGIYTTGSNNGKLNAGISPLCFPRPGRHGADRTATGYLCRIWYSMAAPQPVEPQLQRDTPAGCSIHDSGTAFPSELCRP